MINSLRACAAPPRNLLRALPAFALVALVTVSGCQSQEVSKQGGAGRGIIIVNAPAAGEVRRVLVSEGMSVNEGAPIVEIAVRVEAQAPPQTNAEDPQARASRNIRSAQAEIEAARAEAVRADIEVQRLTPLVASGAAPQSQLDAARADYDRAQQRLQRAQASAQDAQSGIVTARQQARNTSPATVTPSEQIVTARATSAGTVSVISARVGERVMAGQPLATLRAGER